MVCGLEKKTLGEPPHRGVAGDRKEEKEEETSVENMSSNATGICLTKL
jgi:hypothetical protein